MAKSRAETEKTNPKRVRNRRVFYIPGYDPMPPRRYRELYRREGGEQAEISGYDLTLKGISGGQGWTVDTVIDGQATHTEVTPLLWSDIVQSSMDRSIPATFLLLARLVRIYVGSGALARLVRTRKGPVIAALYPIGMLVGQLLISLGVGLGIGWGLLELAGPWLSVGVGAAFVFLMMRLFRRLDRHLFAYYLLHDYAFSAQFSGANPPALEERMADFVSQVRLALTSDVDEVLVVGHSSGAHMGVSVLADVLRQMPERKSGPVLGFLSLGQVVPMVSFLPKATRLRQDLFDLSRHDGLTWIDVTAPGDGCTFALCDPVSVSGQGQETEKFWPLVISAAFTQSLSKARYNALKWRFFRLHFQYLCAFDQPGDYDYFQITAGPIALADRFSGRAPSPSRLTTALSPYQERG